MSLQSKGHSRVFSNTTVQKHQFFDSKRCPQVLLEALTGPSSEHPGLIKDKLLCINPVGGHAGRKADSHMQSSVRAGGPDEETHLVARAAPSAEERASRASPSWATLSGPTNPWTPSLRSPHSPWGSPAARLTLRDSAHWSQPRASPTQLLSLEFETVATGANFLLLTRTEERQVKKLERMLFSWGATAG